MLPYSMHAAGLQQLASGYDRNTVTHAGIAFYLYFLATQREFAYREWKNQMMTRLQVNYTLAFSLMMCLDVDVLFICICNVTHAGVRA